MTDEISDVLNSYHFATLSRMAAAAGLDVIGRDGKRPGKQALLAKMRAEFFTGERIRASWEQLTERERAALDRLLLRGGSAATGSLRRELIRAGLATDAPAREETRRYYTSGVPYDHTDYTGDPGRAGSEVFQDVIARLTCRGLVFSRGWVTSSGGTPFKVQFHPADTLYVPQVVRQHLPEPDPLPSRSVWQPERVEEGAPEVLLRDMYLYWDFVRKNRVTLIQSGYVAKRHLKAINEILPVPDPALDGAKREDGTDRLYLLRQLLEGCRLVRREKASLRPAGKGALHVPRFWQQSQAEQLAACLDAWPHLKVESALLSIADSHGAVSTSARQKVLAALATLQPGVWLEPDELLEQLQDQDPDFFFADRTRQERYYGGYLNSYYRSRLETLLGQYTQLESRFVRNCLAGLLHETGVLELGYTGGELVCFRVTSAGAAMLGAEPVEGALQQPDDETRNDTGKLIVQPNFQLMAIGPVSLALLARLDLFAEREQADRGAFAYRLTRESVYRAQQLGMDVADVRAILEQHGDTDVPQNVGRSLDEWAAHHKRIVFRTGVSLLQAADASLMAALSESAPTGEHLGRVITPEVTLIKEGGLRPLISALVSQGLFPAVSDDCPEAADRGVIVHQDGTVRPVHAVPSLHLRGRLSRLAEEAADGAWKLTPTSILRAGGNRGRVLDLLEELAALHRGELPQQLVESVKAWGGYYGQAAAETLTLIEFRDQATLDELRAYAELELLLVPFAVEGRTLARIPAGKREELEDALSRLGVRVKDGLT